MKKIVTAVIASSLLIAVSAQAQQQTEKVRPTYTYAGLKYMTQDLDDFDCTQDGLLVDGSYDIDGAFFVRGSYADVSGDGCGSSAMQVGGGYRIAWGESSHVYGTLGLIDIDYDGGGDDGLILAGGLRGYVSPGIEAYGEVEYTTLDEGGLAVNAGGAYWFNDQFAATADIGFGNDQTTFSIGARMAF